LKHFYAVVIAGVALAGAVAALAVIAPGRPECAAYDGMVPEVVAVADAPRLVMPTVHVVAVREVAAAGVRVNAY
jgi:hypothetical protein